jgi:hypothetical protein
MRERPAFDAREDAMTAKRGQKATARGQKTARVRDLSARKAADAKGGGMLSNAASNVVKAIGDATSTAARKN